MTIQLPPCTMCGKEAGSTFACANGFQRLYMRVCKLCKVDLGDYVNGMTAQAYKDFWAETLKRATEKQKGYSYHANIRSFIKEKVK